MRATPAPDDRISEDRYGCFSVLFSNVEGYDADEITETFSEFAEVLGVRRAGDDWGIHFVTFGSYEDAKNAVDGLEDHPDVQLKVFHKNKPQYHRRRYDGGADRDRGRADAPGAPRRRRAHSGCRETGERAGNRRGRGHASGWPDDHATEATEDASDGGEEPRCAARSYAGSASDGARVEQPSPVTSETVAASADGGVAQPVAEELELADDVRSMPSVDSAPGAVIEKASEVIVGNVDSRVDEAFLLHLFNKYEPIAVSRLAPVTPRADVRFCSLYFKNDEVAKRVERMCDKLCLVGRQIVVQRPSRLIATYLLQI